MNAVSAGLVLKVARTLMLAMAVAVTSPLSIGSEFKTWKQQQIGGSQQSKDEFAAYREDIKAAFERYSKKTGKVWGASNVRPSRTQWVSYIDRLSQRSVVDFGKGTVKVEMATAARQVNEELQRKRLEKLILKAMLQGQDKRSLMQIANRPVSLSTGSPVLSGLISRDDGTAASRDDYRSIATSAAERFTSDEVIGDDGKTRIVYKAELSLVPDHIRKRAERYQPLITQYSIRYGIPAALINAVIETESMFNPTARSPAPAFGLMQLVPTSGARDAYRYVYKKDRIVTDKYLYDPDNNIKLGTAYLARLGGSYLSAIESDESRMLASIAAYNAGMANVLKAFGGTYSRSRYGSYDAYKSMAFEKINALSPDQVYSTLATRMSTAEARNYIQKVTERMRKYV